MGLSMVFPYCIHDLLAIGSRVQVNGLVKYTTGSADPHTKSEERMYGEIVGLVVTLR